MRKLGEVSGKVSFPLPEYGEGSLGSAFWVWIAKGAFQQVDEGGRRSDGESFIVVSVEQHNFQGVSFPTVFALFVDEPVPIDGQFVPHL